jgi:hypothetical protein
MWRRTLVALVAVAGLLAITGTATAGGWAGSRYAKGDCSYNRDTDTLFCEAWFTTEEETTEQFAASDPTCTSTLRLFERTGTRVTTFRGWGLFAGRTPVDHKELAGNEDSFQISWQDVTDRDLGCSP